MLFKRRKENQSLNIQNLKESIDEIKLDTNKINDKFTKEISRLNRIIKYSKDEPTFHFNVDIFSSFTRKYGVYIYVNKEEYFIDLNEIEGHCIDKNSFEFYVKDDLAYFIISTFSGILRKWKKWEFIIDYKNGKYIVSSKEDTERNNKEKEKSIAQ